MRILLLAIAAGICGVGVAADKSASDSDDVYRKNAFAFLSEDYFARFSLDPNASASADEIGIESDWSIVVGVDADPLVGVMAEDLASFLKQRMGLALSVINNHRQSRGYEEGP